MQLRLDRLDGSYAVCRLPAGAPIPSVDLAAPLFSVTARGDEVSVVCPFDDAPAGALVDGPWAAFAVDGPLDLAMTGVLASLSQPLADAGIPIFVVSTYDTDVVLVPEPRADDAARSLKTFVR